MTTTSTSTCCGRRRATSWPSRGEQDSVNGSRRDGLDRAARRREARRRRVAARRGDCHRRGTRSRAETRRTWLGCVTGRRGVEFSARRDRGTAGCRRCSTAPATAGFALSGDTVRVTRRRCDRHPDYGWAAMESTCSRRPVRCRSQLDGELLDVSRTGVAHRCLRGGERVDRRARTSGPTARPCQSPAQRGLARRACRRRFERLVATSRSASRSVHRSRVSKRCNTVWSICWSSRRRRARSS